MKWESSENVISKEEAWENISKSMESVVDTLGKPIDEGIKEGVTALNANGFGTTGSCEGHVNRGIRYPYVDVESLLAVWSVPHILGT